MYNDQQGLTNGCLNPLDPPEMIQDDRKEVKLFNYCRDCIKSSECMDDDFDNYDCTEECQQYVSKVETEFYNHPKKNE